MSQIIVIATSFVAGVLITLLGFFGFNNFQQNNLVQDQTPNANLSSGLKIVPTEGQIYLGVSETGLNNVHDFETIVGQKLAMQNLYPAIVRGGDPDEYNNGKLEFNHELANRLWDDGYVFMTHALRPAPKISGVTTEDILMGKYDAELKKLADDFKKFGKPMFFTVDREPNGINLNYGGGGFGQDGSMFFTETNDLTRQFDPSKLPTNNLYDKNLYQGLGDPNMCDGLERLAALHRYYYDFFVNREGIDFLTFDTMGWVVNVQENPRDIKRLTDAGCNDFSSLLPLIVDYTDWISIDDYYTDYKEPLQPKLNTLDKIMKIIRQYAPGKPVLFTEVGFCDGSQKNSTVEQWMNLVLSSYPEIVGWGFWGSNLSGFVDMEGECNWTISPNNGDQAIKNIMSQNSNLFQSCVMFSDGTTHPNCDPNRITPFENPISESNQESPKEINNQSFDDGEIFGETEEDELPENNFGLNTCSVGAETGVSCNSITNCSSGELINGCCIAGSCSN